VWENDIEIERETKRVIDRARVLYDVRRYARYDIGTVVHEQIDLNYLKF
jgi:hypothetical protein